jgi:NADPH-dependent 2,4-dienoyl-CoA reductase/sulfur reductase-like enzyme
MRRGLLQARSVAPVSSGVFASRALPRNHHVLLATRGFASGTLIASPLDTFLFQYPAVTQHLFAATEQDDVIVIGGGPGGYVAAIKAGQLGLKVRSVRTILFSSL